MDITPRSCVPKLALELVIGTANVPQIPANKWAGIAPTTSSTMMLALGDAMAVTLLERKSFSSADFKMLHPGGKLGHRLMKVADINYKNINVVAAYLHAVSGMLLNVNVAIYEGHCGLLNRLHQCFCYLAQRYLMIYCSFDYLCI